MKAATGRIILLLHETGRRSNDSNTTIEEEIPLSHFVVVSRAQFEDDESPQVPDSQVPIQHLPLFVVERLPICDLNKEPVRIDTIWNKDFGGRTGFTQHLQGVGAFRVNSVLMRFPIRILT